MHLPDDFLSYRDDFFYDLVREKCGETVEEMFKWQKIRSVQSLLRIDDVFNFMNIDSDELNALKQKVGVPITNILDPMPDRSSTQLYQQ